MNPSNDGGVVHGPHVYGKREDGSMGYMPAPEPEVMLPAKKEVTPIAVVPAPKAASK